jgi:hypothetical protein
MTRIMSWTEGRAEGSLLRARATTSRMSAGKSEGSGTSTPETETCLKATTCAAVVAAVAAPAPAAAAAAAEEEEEEGDEGDGMDAIMRAVRASG